MSRSKHDQKGCRINGEIWGRGCHKVVGGKVYPDCGGEPVGSPKNKKHAKMSAARMRRRKFLLALHLEQLYSDFGE
jgi:hypothetical protein